MAKSLLTRLLVIMSLGSMIVLITYKMYQNYEEQALIQENSPKIKMPIVRRVRRVGNLTFPHLIYVGYRGREYQLGTSSKYFRITAKLDSIEVNYDATRDIVVRADENIHGPYFLLVAVFLCGLLLIGKGVYDFFVDYLASR